MKKINKIGQPAFLDRFSECTPEQIDLINQIIRTQYNRFLGKIPQNELLDEKFGQNVRTPSWRAGSIQDVNYDGISMLNFTFSTKGLQAGTGVQVFQLNIPAVTNSFIYQSGMPSEGATWNAVVHEGVLTNYGRFQIHLQELGNEYFITFIAEHNEIKDGKDTGYLPDKIWNVSLQYFARK